MQWTDYLDPQQLADATSAKILVRAHHVSKTRPLRLGNVIDVSDEAHVEELLAVADVLITDYSSIAYDFELTKRPIIHFVPDLTAYSKERGLYGAWPRQAIVTESVSELVALVQRCFERHESTAAVADNRPELEELARRIERLSTVDASE